MSILSSAAFGLLVFAALRLLRLVYERLARGPRPPYPPGPPGVPILGHLGFPPNPAWVKFRDWGQEYDSDIIHLHAVGSHLIILNSMEAAVDLLDKRSSIYSDRLRMVMAGELIGFDWSILLQRYGSFWRDCRKTFHQCFGPPVLKCYHGAQHRAVRMFLKSCVNSPDAVLENLRHMTASFIIYVAYGIEVKDMDDPIVIFAERAVAQSIGSATAGRYLVDFLPLLKYVPEWFPGGGFKTEARIARDNVMSMLRRPFEIAKKEMLAGTLTPDCGARLMFDEVCSGADDTAYAEDVIRKTLGSMYAGFDTSFSVLSTFFLAMVLHPEIQYEAQQSIDSVCKDRLPTFEDYDELPYVHAIIKECLRWRSVVPLGVAHSSTQDDVYRGYWIPKGSIVFANSWAILHNPTTYPDPDTFHPRRFLVPTPSSKTGYVMKRDIPDPVESSFGFGRRICPGRFLAYEEIWLVVASTLATMSVIPKMSDEGIPIMPSGEYVLSAICTPKPFAFEVHPRSAEHAALIAL